MSILNKNYINLESPLTPRCDVSNNIQKMPKPRILVIARENYLDVTKARIASLDRRLNSQSTILIPNEEGTPRIVAEIDSRTIEAVLMRTLSVKGLPKRVEITHEMPGIPLDDQDKIPESYYNGVSLIRYIHKNYPGIPIFTEFGVASHLVPIASDIYGALERTFGVSVALTSEVSVEYLAEQIKGFLKRKK